MVDPENLDEDGWNAFLAENPATAPAFQFTFQGGVDETLFEKMVGAMSPLIDFMSRLVPLQDLDGITIAADYHQALADLDRGMGSGGAPKATIEAFGTGMAMASAVIRDGKVKTHVTIHAALILGLIGDDQDLVSLSTHMLMHELGHVAEHTLDSERFGDAMLRPMDDKYEFELYRRSHACWSEYYASRVSARWKPDAIEGLRELLLGSLQQLVERIAALNYGVGGRQADRSNEAALEIIDQVAKLMKFAGYVIGHARGADMSPIEPEGPELAILEEIGLDGWFDKLGEALDTIYDGRNEWTSLSAFYLLHRLLEAGCLTFQLELHRSPGYDIAWRFWY